VVARRDDLGECAEPFDRALHIARTNSIVPDSGIARYLGVVATAAAIALITSSSAGLERVDLEERGGQ
jgi:hypothetical protein